MKVDPDTIRNLDEHRARRDVEAYEDTLVTAMEDRLRELDPEFMADVERLFSECPRWRPKS